MPIWFVITEHSGVQTLSDPDGGAVDATSNAELIIVKTPSGPQSFDGYNPQTGLPD